MAIFALALTENTRLGLKLVSSLTEASNHWKWRMLQNNHFNTNNQIYNTQYNNLEILYVIGI